MLLRRPQMSLYTLALLVTSAAGVFALTFELPAKQFPLDHNFGDMGRPLTDLEIRLRLVVFSSLFGFELIGIAITRRLRRDIKTVRKPYSLPNTSNQWHLWP